MSLCPFTELQLEQISRLARLGVPDSAIAHAFVVFCGFRVTKAQVTHARRTHIGVIHTRRSPALLDNLASAKR